MSDWRSIEGRLAASSCGNGPRLVFVHGFTQTAESWKPIAAQFAADGYESIVVEVPGHGGSTNIRADLREAADMLTTQCGLAVYIGYSLGGRLCLHAAVMSPHLVRGLAVVGASPGIADETERADRRVADDKLADHIIDVGIDSFLDEWLDQPLFAGLELDESQRAARRTNTSEGLASSLRLAGTGAQHSLWPRLRDIDIPVLAISGELDYKFAAIGRRVAGEVPDGEFVEIHGAGHAAQLQQPELVVSALTAWLRAIKY